MSEMNQSPEENPVFPEDLRVWIDEAKLLTLVFDAVHAIEEEVGSAYGATGLPAGSPRILLTLLTYSYAVGCFASDEIQAKIPFDPSLQYLAAKTCPSANSLRHFRRYHRSILQRSLSNLLWLAWQHRDQDATGNRGTPTPLFDQLAMRRVEEAVLADTMALDN
jgi:hypothetical protein